MSKRARRVSVSTHVTKGTHSPLVSELENLMRQDMEEVDTLNDSFALVFTSKPSLRNPRPERPEGLWGNDGASLVKKYQVRE